MSEFLGQGRGAGADNSGVLEIFPQGLGRNASGADAEFGRKCGFMRAVRRDEMARRK